MRLAAVSIFAVVVAAGCASHRPPAEPAAKVYVDPPDRYASAGSLVFDPPMALYEPLPSFSRVGRAPELFVGYEEQSTSSLFIFNSDRQLSGYPDRVDRRAYSTRSFVTSR